MGKKVFLCLVIIVLFLSFTVFNIFSKQLSMDNHENRFLTTFPQVLQANSFSEFKQSLNDFIADNAPFRYQFIKIINEMNYYLFHETDSSQVLLGKEGWMFLKDGPNSGTPLANYQGLLSYPDELIDAFCDNLDSRARYYSSQGITVCVVFAPCKASIYGQYVPDEYPIINPENRTDKLAYAAENRTTAIISYEKERLRSLGLNNQLYFPRDTHWNHAGALIALDSILSQLGLETNEDFSQYSFEAGATMEMDLPNLCGLYDVFPLCHDYYPSNYQYELDDRRVMVMGDSFSTFFTYYLEKRFSSVEWKDIRTNSFEEVVEMYRPDIIILEANERYMDSLIHQFVYN